VYISGLAPKRTSLNRVSSHDLSDRYLDEYTRQEWGVALISTPNLRIWGNVSPPRLFFGHEPLGSIDEKTT